jgi:Xaa-Pro aminopeptidase
MIYEELKPSVREADIVGKANELLYRLGSDDVEAINAISGERCNPHPHNFTDRIVRPGDQAFFDVLQSYQGYRTRYYLGLAIHEQPIISRQVSLDQPMEIKTGMVFALETYCPAKDGYSAARIEEEVVATDTGCTIISLFPAEELPIANRY